MFVGPFCESDSMNIKPLHYFWGGFFVLFAENLYLCKF